MDQKTYLECDGMALADLVKKRETTPEELVNAAFTRLEKVNPDLNAVIRTRKCKVLKEIKKLQLENQPFAGVPMVLKDISQAIEAEPLTAGSRLLKNNIAQRDSNFTAKLRRAGFIFIGQTNTPEFGLKNVTEPELYGATRNPWNLEYSPGGSSGGSAASAASGIVPIAGASDGGGSIRIPASFTGLVGLKPTRGRTPVGPGAGRQWQGASIDFVLTRSVRDCAAMLDILQTVQPEAAFQTPLFPGIYAEEMNRLSNRKFRIAFTTDSPVGTFVSEEAKEAVHKTVLFLDQQGHYIEEKTNKVDGLRLIENYYLMNNGEMANMIEVLEKFLERPITVNDMEVTAWVLYTAGKLVSAAEFTRSLAEWDTAAAQMAEFHQKYDLYITPSTADSAPRIGQFRYTQEELTKLLKISETAKEDHSRLVYKMFEKSLAYTPFTQLANLTGQPAISVPVHLTKEGMPLGVQFMAPKGREDMLLQIASLLENSRIWVDILQNPSMSIGQR